MTTTFNDIFEQLLNDSQVDLTITGRDAEVLRSNLCRRWSQYKSRMDHLGFLSDEMKNLSISMKLMESCTRYSLKFRDRRANYQIIEDTNGSPTTAS